MIPVCETLGLMSQRSHTNRPEGKGLRRQIGSLCWHEAQTQEGSESFAESGDGPLSDGEDVVIPDNDNPYTSPAHTIPPYIAHT
jgi:hypothetical protein